MTLYQFNQLDEMEQAEAVRDGVMIGDREDEEHKDTTISNRCVLCRGLLS